MPDTIPAYFFKARVQRDRIGVGIYQSCRRQASRIGRLYATVRAGAFAAALSCVLVAGARAQAPFVPTPLPVVERMLALAKVGPSDYVIDLGSGDGRIVREAAKTFGARGFGVEHDPELVARSRELARSDGVADKVTFMMQDLFETDVSDATVVTMYLFPEINLKLRPRLLRQLKPGARIVSHDFRMGDWEPDAIEKLHAEDKYGEVGGESTVYLWIVPANLAGRWSWRLEVAGQVLDYELTAVQRFQKIEANVRVGGETRPVRDVRLRGDEVSFTVLGEVKGSTVRQAFSGRAAGDGIQGSVMLSGPRLQGAAEWVAERTERGAPAAAARRDGGRFVSAQAPGRALGLSAGGMPGSATVAAPVAAARASRERGLSN
jgi:SAM-dependent methyltransferase